jgi:hypothetical protein
MASGKVFVHGTAAAKQKQWNRVHTFSLWIQSQALRRVLTLVWLGLLAVDLKLAYSAAQLSAVSAIYPTLTLFGLALWSFRRMDIGLTQPSLNDRALAQFGNDFGVLRESDRKKVFDQQVRDQVRSVGHQDERENALRTRSEAIAYQFMRPGLIAAVAVYWAICLLGPFAAIRTALAITAIAFTWLALMVLVLPTMIRLWTEPDEVGEAYLISKRANERILGVPRNPS